MRKLEPRYEGTPLSCHTISRSVKVFNNLGNVEKQVCRKDASSFCTDGANIQFLLRQRAKASLRKAAADLGISFTMQNILKSFHMFSYKIRRVHQLKQQGHPQQAAFFQLFMENLSFIIGFTSGSLVLNGFSRLNICEH